MSKSATTRSSRLPPKPSAPEERRQAPGVATVQATDSAAAQAWPPNSTPGEILLEEFLKPLQLSQTALAHSVFVPPRRINEIVLGKRSVTADTDLRLTRDFGLSAGFFLGLQADYDLLDRRRAISAELDKIAPRAA